MLDEVGVAGALRKADLLVVPSSSEGLPAVIMEAMASGLPVIASEIDGIPELVRDGETGLLVPPCNAERLAEAIIRLLDDPSLARRMGETGRRLVAQCHDADRNAHALLRAIFSDTVVA
jgi:glycosyltransferase involved in cell wall biosynthesis